MSEKRFVLDKVEKGNAILSVRITDSVTDYNYFIMTKEAYEDDIDEIVDRLNEQQATIQSLKEENEQLKHWNKCLAEKRHNEKESNENSIKKLIGKIDFLERIIDGDL